MIHHSSCAKNKLKDTIRSMRMIYETTVANHTEMMVVETS